MLEVVLEELFEFPVPNLEDIDEYPEVNELDPEMVGKPSDAEDENIGGKDTGCPAWIPMRNPAELPTLDGGEPDLLRVRLKLALKIKEGENIC